MSRSTKRNLKEVVLVTTSIAAGGAAYLFIRAPRVLKNPLPPVSAAAVVIAIVFLTYFIFALAGYRIRNDEIVGVPRWLALVVVTLVTVAAIAVMLMIASFSLR